MIFQLLVLGVLALAVQGQELRVFDDGFFDPWEDWSWPRETRDGIFNNIHPQSGNSSYFIQSAGWNGISLTCRSCDVLLRQETFVRLQYWVFAETAETYKIQLTELFLEHAEWVASFEHTPLAGVWQAVTLQKEQMEWNNNTNLNFTRVNFFMSSNAGGRFWFDNVSLTYALPANQTLAPAPTLSTTTRPSSSSLSSRSTASASSSSPSSRSSSAPSPTTNTTTQPTLATTTPSSVGSSAGPNPAPPASSFLSITNLLTLTSTLSACSAAQPCQSLQVNSASVVLSPTNPSGTDSCFWYSSTSQLSGDLIVDVSGLTIPELLDGQFCLYSSATSLGQFEHIVLEGQTCQIAVGLEFETESAAAMLTFSDATCSTSVASSLGKF